MTTANQFGEMDWLSIGGGKKGNSDWMRLVDGDNEVRIVTKSFQYMCHKLKADPSNPKDYGQKVLCSMPTHGSCPLCDLGEDKAKARYYIGVICRKTNSYKIMDVGYGVVSGIKVLVSNARWGNPMNYDISIKFDKNQPPASMYSVTPLGKEPLSASDQKIVDAIDQSDLLKKSTPPKPEYVLERMAKIRPAGVPAVPAVVTARKEVAAKKAAAPPPTPVVNDDDEDFPSYN